MKRIFLAVALLIFTTAIAWGQISGGKMVRDSKVDRELTKVEEEWHSAYVKHDPSILECILAEEYVSISSNGGSADKAQTIAGLKRDDSQYEYSTPHDLDIRIYGDGAIVIGRTKEKWKNKKGEEFTAEYRWTDLFVKRDGRWQCVAAQVARVPPPKPAQ